MDAMNVDRASPVNIAIAGGGIAGLALALALQERNIPCHVFESHPPSQSADTASLIGIALNGILALEGIKPGLSSALAQVGSYCTQLKWGNARDGKEEVTTVEGVPPRELILVTWKSVHRTLGSFVTSSSISFSLKLLSYKPCQGGVEVYFQCPKEGSDGHKIRVVPCKLLIGADGIWSAVRKQMVGDEPRYLKMRNWSALVYDPHVKLVDGLEKRDFIFRRVQDSARSTCIIASSGEHTLWSFRRIEQTGDLVNSLLPDRITLGRPGCKNSALQELDGLYIWDDLRKAIEDTSEENITEGKSMDRLPLSKWSDADGHVLLIGDAAHAQFVGPGQGAMSAFEDVHQLSLLLEMARGLSFSEESMKEAVKRFEELRIPRTKKMQEYAAYSSTIPDFQPEWAQDLSAEERLKLDQEYRKWINAYPHKQQGDPESIYFK